VDPGITTKRKIIQKGTPLGSLNGVAKKVRKLQDLVPIQARRRKAVRISTLEKEKGSFLIHIIEWNKAGQLQEIMTTDQKPAKDTQS
jgi:hypothetical protein